MFDGFLWFGGLFCVFIDFTDRQEAGVGEDMRAYDDGTNS
jgi:hypothetical protein